MTTKFVIRHHVPGAKESDPPRYYLGSPNPRLPAFGATRETAARFRERIDAARVMDSWPDIALVLSEIEEIEE